MTKPTVAENADTIVTITMTETAAGDETDGRDDDDRRWAEAVIASLPSRSREARKALAEALLDGGGSMPLLGLELATTENKRENDGLTEDSNQQAMLAPLLGTIVSDIAENARKSSSRRSPERVCYGNPLRQYARTLDETTQETVTSRTPDCYGEVLRDVPKGVFRRGRKLYYRHMVPVDVRGLLGRSEIWRSLRTDSCEVALRRLPLVVSAIEAEVERARADAGRSIDWMLITPPMSDAVGRSVTMTDDASQPSSLSLGAAYRNYIDDPTRSWSRSTREAYETSRKLAVSVIGESLPISSLARVHCRELLEVLRFLPRNAAKRFPRLSPREAAERAKNSTDANVISAANANALMSNFSSFLNWAVNEELLNRNPARGLRLPDNVAKRDKRLPFAPEQLRRIFHAPLYSGCIDDRRGYNKVGDERPRNARFWIPLIGLFTGARLGEICQLDACDIRRIDDIDCIVISAASLVGTTDKRLKTGASERIIPLHPILRNCGLPQFAEHKRSSGQVKLFDDIETGKTGSRSVAFSKWFTQFLRASGAQRSRTSFHSFRHNFRDELRAARIDHDIAMALGGWTTGGSSRVVSENYGSGHRVDALHDAIVRLAFANVDVRHLALNAR